MIPVQQTSLWAKRIANSEIATFDGADYLLFLETSKARGQLGAILGRSTLDVRKIAR